MNNCTCDNYTPYQSTLEEGVAYALMMPLEACIHCYGKDDITLVPTNAVRRQELISFGYCCDGVDIIGDNFEETLSNLQKEFARQRSVMENK